MSPIKTLVNGFKSPEVPIQRKLFLVLSLIYFVFPIDVIPDIIPLLGYTDDIGLFGYSLWTFYKEAKEVEMRQTELKSTTTTVKEVLVTDVVEVVEDIKTDK